MTVAVGRRNEAYVTFAVGRANIDRQGIPPKAIKMDPDHGQGSPTLQLEEHMKAKGNTSMCTKERNTHETRKNDRPKKKRTHEKKEK